ncbi:poly(3-hydroxyalkanoate) synthetase [Cupriavidus sp. UYMSc13B]|nr:poly(3-hydroxyalkanoate) synthetase [Cupriavidus sp. UYMSc13B]
MAEDTIQSTRRAARAASRTGVPEVPSVAVLAVEDARPYSVPATAAIRQWWEYSVDLAQRWTLFVDILRQRANNMLAHEEAGLPPLLHFDYEMLLDARSFERPANYALLRITRCGTDHLEKHIRPGTAPVIVIDPRAGHGPGIGGFKRDSEVGMALAEGHPVYFVSFFPIPCPGQTLGDVLHALRMFVQEVARRHDGRAPVLYGNCQAGWEVVLLSALCCEQVSGLSVLNGSPLSYWSGEPGMNPMRLLGAFTGGAWSANFLADLGNGRFDGAWLVQNFQALKPEAALWAKFYAVFANPGREGERFLEFERWWNGFYFLSREELIATVQDLFVGNKLESGEVHVDCGCTVDLRRIRKPIAIFASYGDNITPPHQALGWIPVVYESTEDLVSAGQRIVYLTNPHVGHLGIFVSADVARHEHRAILQSLDDIEALPPGLYEMKLLDDSKMQPQEDSKIAVAFEPRRVEDIQFPYPHAMFERVRAVSEFHEKLYDQLLSPYIRAAATPWGAEWLKWAHPMRWTCYAWSERFQPWLSVVAAMANEVKAVRQETAPENMWRASEESANTMLTGGLQAWRSVRDVTAEAAFLWLYGQPWAESLALSQDSKASNQQY